MQTLSDPTLLAPWPSAGYSDTVPSSDAQLIRRVLNDESKAHNEFVERYRRYVYGLLSGSRARAQDYEDIYQEVQIRLWQHNKRGIRRWQATGMREFKPYLRAIVRHLVCDHERSRRQRDLREVPLEEEPNTGVCAPLACCRAARQDSLSDLDAYVLRKEQQGVLYQAIARLSPRDADIAQRYYFADQTYQEISDALHMTTDNVGVTLTHIRKRLRKHLEDLDIEIFDAFLGTRKPRPARPPRRAGR